MSTPALSSPCDDPSNPPGSQGQNPEHPAASEVFEAVRRAHLTDESYVKAVGILNYAYGIFFGISAVYFVVIAIQHLRGKLGAPWIIQPRWIFTMAIAWAMTIASILTGYGLRRLRWWALWSEAFFILCLLLNWFISITISPGRIDRLDMVTMGCFYITLVAPMLNLLDVRRSVILESSYRRAIEATPTIRVKAKIPWELKLISFVLFLTFVSLLYVRGLS